MADAAFRQWQRRAVLFATVQTRKRAAAAAAAAEDDERQRRVVGWDRYLDRCL